MNSMNILLEPPLALPALAPKLAMLHPKRILVVEDDLELRRINARVLSGNGYHVDTAGDGVEGWKALCETPFHLLITDHDMPMLSGLELVKKVRKEHMDLPVILASGAPPEEELEREPWIKLAAILLKPFSPIELLNIVKTVLSMNYPIRIEVADDVDANSPNNNTRRPSSQHWGIDE